MKAQQPWKLFPPRTLFRHAKYRMQKTHEWRKCGRPFSLSQGRGWLCVQGQPFLRVGVLNVVENMGYIVFFILCKPPMDWVVPAQQIIARKTTRNSRARARGAHSPSTCVQVTGINKQCSLCTVIKDLFHCSETFIFKALIPSSTTTHLTRVDFPCSDQLTTLARIKAVAYF